MRQVRAPRVILSRAKRANRGAGNDSGRRNDGAFTRAARH